MVYEARSDHPSLDVTYFRNRRFSASVAAIGSGIFAATGHRPPATGHRRAVRGALPTVGGQATPMCWTWPSAGS
ncbi:hypothetical protein [Streptomyces sp. R41]|uniref:Uncharacterized protein n=1 Tax=Streptomyces sp. R41 TaxID=3238632 RepID=A0AB39RUK9_9ACTN